MNGHTSGLRLFRSDEADAGQRERWRRMRHALRAREIARLCRNLNGQRKNNRCRNCCDILLITTRLGEQLNRRSGTLMRGGTASLVCATTRLTCFFARRVGNEARRCGQSDGCCKKRESDCNRHRDLAKHHTAE